MFMLGLDIYLFVDFLIVYHSYGLGDIGGEEIGSLEELENQVVCYKIVFSRNGYIRNIGVIVMLIQMLMWKKVIFFGFYCQIKNVLMIFGRKRFRFF